MSDRIGVISIKPGDVIVCTGFNRQDVSEVLAAIKMAFDPDMPPRDAPVLFLDAGKTIETLDPIAMRAAGWIRLVQ